MKKTIYLHIGYGKSGSTYLQNIFYLNKNFNSIFLRNREINPINIKKKIKKIKSLYVKNKINIISDEGFTSPFFKKNFDIFKNLDETINLLKKFFNLKIIVIIRNQKNWLISRFSQNPLRFLNIDKKFYSYKQVTKNLFQEKVNKKLNHFKNANNYYEMFLFLKKKVNKKNFQFLIFEDLIENEKLFLRKLNLFLNKKNIFKEKDKIIKNEFKYQTNRIGKFYIPKIKISKIFYLFRIYGIRLTFKLLFFNKFLLPNPNHNAHLIEKHYLISNKKLSILIRENLKEYNYF